MWQRWSHEARRRGITDTIYKKCDLVNFGPWLVNGVRFLEVTGHDDAVRRMILELYGQICPPMIMPTLPESMDGIHVPEALMTSADQTREAAGAFQPGFADRLVGIVRDANESAQVVGSQQFDVAAANEYAKQCGMLPRAQLARLTQEEITQRLEEERLAETRARLGTTPVPTPQEGGATASNPSATAPVPDEPMRQVQSDEQAALAAQMEELTRHPPPVLIQAPASWAQRRGEKRTAGAAVPFAYAQEPAPSQPKRDGRSTC